MTLVTANRSASGHTSSGDTPLQRLDPGSIQELKPTDLPYQLLGTSTGQFEFALLKQADSEKVRRLRVGESWQELELRDVEEEWVTIRNRSKDREELLKLRRSRRSLYRESDDAGDVQRVSRYQINQAVHNNMNNLLSAVEAQPVMNDGSLLGFRLRSFHGKPGKLLQRLGFREGDVIRRVNGQPVDSMEQAMQLWTQLKNKQHFRIQILREGEPRILEYSLAR